MFRRLYSTQVAKTAKASIWLDNLFPISRFAPDIRFLVAPKDPRSRALELMPTLENVQVTEVTPNYKEGGMLVEVNYQDVSDKELVEKVVAHLEQSRRRSLYNLQPIRAFLVKGAPFMEDMVGRVPSRRIKVEFDGPDLSIESLYRTLRPFGRIVDISLFPVKDGPHFAIVTFAWVRSASTARNCAHGQVVKGTRISISYEKTLGFLGTILKWMREHPRIMIPILLGLLAGTTYLIFDPIRVWFIGNKITNRFRLRDKFNNYWLGVTSNNALLNLFTGKPGKGTEDAWEERALEESKLLSSLQETPNALTLVYGPRGSGKSTMVRKVQKNVMYHLTVDCDDLINVPEHEMLSRFASQVGYYPQLNFLVSSSAMIDTLIAATTGAKGNFTTTSESQVKKILETLTLSLTHLSISQTKHFSSEKSSKKDQEADNSDIKYPVIFIEGFMSKERARNDYIYDLLATWAAIVEENRLAHVVFVSNNPGAIKSLSKVMPNKPVELISLHDASTESSLSYVQRRLNLSESSVGNLKGFIEALGGRQTDLELFIQKVKAGLDFQSAYNEMVFKSVSELRKLGLGEDDFAKKTSWSAPQFWKVIQVLSKHESIDYDELRQHGLFKGNEMPIQHMENAGLITIEYINGRPKIIRPGRPVYKMAFIQMVSDLKLNAFMGIQVIKAIRNDLDAKIIKYEEEMATITKIISGYGSDGLLLSRESRVDLEGRLSYLAGLVAEEQRKVGPLTNQEREYKKILKLKD